MISPWENDSAFQIGGNNIWPPNWQEKSEIWNSRKFLRMEEYFSNILTKSVKVYERLRGENRTYTESSLTRELFRELREHF